MSSVLNIVPVWGIAAVLMVPLLPARGADWKQYVEQRLADVIAANQASMESDDDYIFTADNFPTKTRVTFRGGLRAIPSARKLFIAAYLGKVRGRPEWVDLFQQEIRCREGDRDFWLPIQEPVLVYFRDEVVAGATVDLYATWLGAHRLGDGLDWVFVVNEFLVVDEAE